MNALTPILAADAAAQSDSAFRRRVERLLVQLHNEDQLSEGQCAKVLDIHRIAWRKIVDEAALEHPTTARPDERAEVTKVEYETAVETLRHVIDCLRKTGTYTDEEGDATDYLEPLLIAAAPQAALSDAARDLLAERARQVCVEGWTAEHDDKYRDHEMSCAAGCYAMHTLAYPAGDPPSAWPWAASWWKPKTHRQNLLKAGALILADIERIDRKGGEA